LIDTLIDLSHVVIVVVVVVVRRHVIISISPPVANTIIPRIMMYIFGSLVECIESGHFAFPQLRALVVTAFEVIQRLRCIVRVHIGGCVGGHEI